MPDHEEEEVCEKQDDNDEGSDFELDNDDEIGIDPSLMKPRESEQPLYLLPLYSMLAPHRQKMASFYLDFINIF